MSNKRIEAITKYIDEEDKVIDVGCDHGLLSQLLAKRGIASIASDINPNIIEKRIKENESNLITYVVSDGLQDIDEDLYDTVVIAGMGAKTAIKIIKESNKIHKKIITVVHTDLFELRHELSKMGYEIELEEIIEDRDIFYNLIIFKYNPSHKRYSYSNLMLGVHIVNKDVYKKQCQLLEQKYKNICDKLPTRCHGQKAIYKQLLRDIHRDAK